MLLRLVCETSLHLDKLIAERVHVHEVLRDVAERLRMGHWRGAGRARGSNTRLSLLAHVLEHVLHVVLAAITIRLDGLLHGAIIVVRESGRSCILLCKPVMGCFHWGRGVVSLELSALWNISLHKCDVGYIPFPFWFGGVIGLSSGLMFSYLETRSTIPSLILRVERRIVGAAPSGIQARLLGLSGIFR